LTCWGYVEIHPLIECHLPNKEEHMDLSQSKEGSGTINELRAVVRAKSFEDVCASRASTVRMGNKNPSLF
jgi:hypothetical protein